MATGEDRMDLFTKPVHTAETAPRLADGRPPRGLTADGWVRTTGWLQFGDHPVSSAHIAALAGLLWALVVAMAMVATAPVASGVVVLGVPVLCGVLWSLLTTRVKPASTGRNTGTKSASDLAPGDVVRLHGSIGPVGRVVAVTADEQILVDFHGGTRRSWPPDRAVHLTKLLS